MKKKTKTNKNELSERQLKALPFFFECGTIQEACKSANIAKVTYYEWLKEPLFKAELDRLREEAASEAFKEFKGKLGLASRKLIGLLDDPSPALVRLVCNDLIGWVVKSKELDIEKRLDEIEAKLKAEKG